MITAAAYIRVSTDDQIEYSPDSQLKKIREYAFSHNMCIPEEYIFVDEGISGRTAIKRPAFQNMISIAKTTHCFQKILVWKFSRFARNRQDSILYKSMLRKECGIEVISVTEPLSDDPTSILIEALLEAMDEFYSINLSQEVKRGMDERFSRGLPISIAPFGYTFMDGNLIICPEQAVWVKYIFEAYASGASYKQIANELNRHSVFTNRGNTFEARAISYIIHNPVYYGVLRKRADNKARDSFNMNTPSSYDRNYEAESVIYVYGTHPPIITKELWTQCQLRPETSSCLEASSCPVTSNCPENSNHSGKSNSHTQSGTLSDYYLKGLIFCHSCGRVLVQVNHGYAFQCSGYNHRKCSSSHYIKREALEALVRITCSEHLSPAAYIKLEACMNDYRVMNRILQDIFTQLTYNSETKEIIPTIRRS